MAKLTEDQIAAYVRYVTILGNIQRRLLIEQKQRRSESAEAESSLEAES
jgi:hypothetical protein